MKKIIVPIILSTLLFSTFVLSNSNKEVAITEAAAPINYYSSITSNMKGDTLKEALYNIIKNHDKQSYDGLEVAMKVTDRDYNLSPIGTDDDDPYMYLMYADYNGNKSTAQKWSKSHGSYGTLTNYVWNKEHIWAKANGFGNSESCPAYSDLHHLRASDWKCNNTRSNYPFGNVSSHTTSNASYDWTGSRRTDNYLSNGVFEPRDSDKGDVARALFYMATRYYNGDGSANTHLTLTTSTDSSGGKWGYLDTLLAWHKADPVDEFEAHRNDLIYEQFQHNRNPYIDHPEYARAVFKNEPLVEPDTLTNLTYSGNPTKTSYKEGESFSSAGLTVTATFEKEDNSTYTQNVTSDISWSPNPLVKNTTTVTGSYTHGSVTKFVYINNITVSSLDSIRISGNPTKSIYDVGDIFVPSGISVYAAYGNEEVDVTSSATWSSAPLVKGQTSVSVSYGNKQATYCGILVKEKAETSNRIQFKSYSGSSELSANTIQSDLVSGSNIATISSASKIFQGDGGIRFASGSYTGTLTIGLKSNTQVTKLVLNAKKYSNDSPSVTVSINGTSAGTFNPTNSNYTDYEVTINKSATSITISAAKNNRFHLKYIDVYSGSGSSTSSLTEWGVSYLHIGDSSFDGPGTGLCKSNDLYKYAKVALLNIESSESGSINTLKTDSKYSSEYNRYVAWAKACEDLTPFDNDFSFVNNALSISTFNNDNSTLMIIVIAISITSVLAISLILIKKRKHQ